MSSRLFRSKNEPIREALTWHQRWEGPDRGLIWCWERGRQKRIEDPQLAARAASGELVFLAWTGGVEKKLASEKKGCLQYLATWQGLRGDNMDIDTKAELEIVCAKTGQLVVFSQNMGRTISNG